MVEGCGRVKIGTVDELSFETRGNGDTDLRRRSGSGVLSLGSMPFTMSPLFFFARKSGWGNEGQNTHLKLKTWRSPICS